MGHSHCPRALKIVFFDDLPWNSRWPYFRKFKFTSYHIHEFINSNLFHKGIHEKVFLTIPKIQILEKKMKKKIKSPTFLSQLTHPTVLISNFLANLSTIKKLEDQSSQNMISACNSDCNLRTETVINYERSLSFQCVWNDSALFLFPPFSSRNQISFARKSVPLLRWCIPKFWPIQNLANSLQHPQSSTSIIIHNYS